MKKGQRSARRMALYLSSIGIPTVTSAGSYKQWATGLQLDTTHWRSGSESSRDRPDGGSSKSRAPLRSQSHLSHTQLLYSPRWPTLHLSPPEPDPERSSSTIFAGAGLRSHRLVPPAGCGTASLNVPGPLASGPMRFGEDSTIATPCVSTSAPFSRASGIWVIFARQLPPLSSRMNTSFPPCQLPVIPYETGGHA